MIINISSLRKTMQYVYAFSCLKLTCLTRSICHLMLRFFRLLLFTNPFWIELCYFLSLSFIGFWFLKVLKPRPHSFRPRNLDLFFTSVSAATVSSMSTVEMEVFSNSQLVIITILMFIGGEVFTSMAGIFLKLAKLMELLKDGEDAASVLSSSSNSPSSLENTLDTIELGVIMTEPDSIINKEELVENDHCIQPDNFDRQYHSIKFLGFVVLVYLLLVNGIGIALVSLYLSLVSTASQVIKSKGLKLFTFSVFTTVSTFASCGFVPTNENMMVFRKNSGLLLILIPQVLLGISLFPSCLRLSIWVVGKFVKKEESKYLLANTKEIGYHHLLSWRHSSFLVVTVLGFVVVQFLMFCLMEWNSEATTGLNAMEKIVGLLFESVSTRHTGETIVDLSIISPTILVVMMCLPRNTSFMWINNKSNKNGSESEMRRKRRGKIVDNVVMSQLSHLAIFVVLICTTERQKMKDDPLNFSVFNIVLQVISAYGNVGFTMGYSCKRQIKAGGDCEDKWYGLEGRWSDQGKIILIAVMFFGRLKKFNINGGKAWKLLQKG